MDCHNEGNSENHIYSTIFQYLAFLIVDSELYTNPRLSIGEISKITGLKQRDISRAINVGANTNFCRYLNLLRLNQVLDVFSSGSKGTSILDTAFSMGFNSKSTFNAFFKQELGQTPSQYISSFRKLH